MRALEAILLICVIAIEAGVITSFKVLGFYSGTYDAAHIAFEKEANPWFSHLASQHNFQYESTNDWNRLNNINASQYQVVFFLDDQPGSASQHAGFQRYMENGGGWFGFHVCAFNTNPNSWSWYYNTFLGNGAFKSNTWFPTKAILKIENRQHPSTKRLPEKVTSMVSEWYAWNHDLRQNSDINILASVDPSSFPLGTDPNQSWRSGYYPIMWTNKKYKMIYANFGHNAMNYQKNIQTSSTFDSGEMNKFILDAILWLGGASNGTSVPDNQNPDQHPDQPSPSNWYTMVNKGNNKCVDVRAAGAFDGAIIEQYTCNLSQAQQFQFQMTSDGFIRANTRLNADIVLDVKDKSSADNAHIQLWTYSDGNNQQWKLVAEGGGYYHIVNRQTSKCLDVPGASGADSVQLVQHECNGSATQSFQLKQQ